GVPLPQSLREDSRHHRPAGTGWRAAAPVRVRRDTHLPRGQVGDVSPTRPRAALPGAAVAHVPGGRYRPDVRAGRLLSQIRGQAYRGQAAAAALRPAVAATPGGARRTA